MGRIEWLLAGIAYVGKDRPDGDHRNTKREE
jgi:hypothetical protein